MAAKSGVAIASPLWGVVWACAWMLMGCAGLEHAPRVDGSGPSEIPGVPFYPQEEYQCGPAALAMMLGWSGINTTPEGLAQQVYLPARRGSLQMELLASARRHGRVAYVLSPDINALSQEVEAGHPVLVLQNLSLALWPRWHYAVVVGVDRLAQDLVLRSGARAHHRVSMALFERTWQRSGRWAAVILPPSQLPMGAQEALYLRAAVGLEGLGHYVEARMAYSTVIARWPASGAGWLALANTHMAQSAWGAAESALLQAVSDSLVAADAYNNLAYALWYQDRHQEALVAARQAVDLGGIRRGIYQETLEELLKIKTGGAGLS